MVFVLGGLKEVWFFLVYFEREGGERWRCWTLEEGGMGGGFKGVFGVWSFCLKELKD